MTKLKLPARSMPVRPHPDTTRNLSGTSTVLTTSVASLQFSFPAILLYERKCSAIVKLSLQDPDHCSKAFGRHAAAVIASGHDDDDL